MAIFAMTAQQSLTVMLCLTIAFFFIEIIVGFITNSMAMIADSFHMFSDAIALVIAFVSVRMSPKEWSKNTFGWARAEVLGALVNSVFLCALCVSILIESVKRFIKPELIHDPHLLIFVGSCGLLINLIGLCMFNEGHHHHHHHSHGHSHSHQHTHHHSHSRAAAHDTSNGAARVAISNPKQHETNSPSHDCDDDDDRFSRSVGLNCRGGDTFAHRSRRNSHSSSSANKDSLPLQDESIEMSSNLGNNSNSETCVLNPRSADDEHHKGNQIETCSKSKTATTTLSSAKQDILHDHNNDTTDSNSSHSKKIHTSSSTTKNKHHQHNQHHQHTSASQMNMRGVFLHVLADALGSVVVIFSAFIVKFTPETYQWRVYVDPSLSVIMVCVILASTWPLLIESGMILLQTVPTHIQVEQMQRKLTEKVDGVLAVHEFHVWQLNGDKIIASAHIRCHSLDDYMRIAEEVKEFFHNEGIHSTTIQPEFTDIQPGTNIESIENCVLDCPTTPGPSCAPLTCCGST